MTPTKTAAQKAAETRAARKPLNEKETAELRQIVMHYGHQVDRYRTDPEYPVEYYEWNFTPKGGKTIHFQTCDAATHVTITLGRGEYAQRLNAIAGPWNAEIRKMIDEKADRRTPAQRRRDIEKAKRKAEAEKIDKAKRAKDQAKAQALKAWEA